MRKSILVGNKEDVARMRKAVEQRAIDAVLNPSRLVNRNEMSKRDLRIATFNHPWVLENK